MQAGQWKRGQVMIEAHIGLPGLYAMAVTAGGTQRLRVHIVAAMTGHASRLQFFIFRDTLVAGHTGSFSMGTEQRKLRFLCMVELRLIPGPGRVAGLALGPVPAMVRVITAMAIDTGLASRFLEIVSGMAGLAGKPSVAGCQGETGFLCMIEGLLLPCARPMTVFTSRTTLTLVRIVDPVTCNAGRGCVLVALSGVTQAALNLVVRACKRITLVGGLGVIELDLFPSHHVVTTDAVFAQGFLVDVLFHMATDAGRRRIAMLFFRLVTVVAGSALVCALERIVGQGMIEGLRCQTHDVCVAAFMVSMTIPALALSRGL